MTTYALNDLLIMGLPFVLWLVGVLRKTPFLVILAGMMMVLVGLFYNVTGWVVVLLVGMGVILLLGGISSARNT